MVYHAGLEQNHQVQESDKETNMELSVVLL